MKRRGAVTYKRFFSKKAQAMVELAIFGSLLMVAFATLLSYVQRQSDQQYADMSAFRRALASACTKAGTDAGGNGASVQYTQLENRRHVDTSSGFKKGSPSSVSASADVFWAVPKSGDSADSLIMYRINEDELPAWDYETFVPENESDNQSFRIESTVVDTATDYSEAKFKGEDATGINNTRTASLRDTVHTQITYTIRGNDSDSDPENDPIISGPTNLIDIDQGLYKDGYEYKYSQSMVNNTVNRSRSWQTDF